MSTSTHHLIAAVLLMILIPAAAQAGSWTVSNPTAEVADGTVTLSAEVTRSFGGGELTWRESGEWGSGLYVAGNQYGTASISVDGEQVDCPGVEYTGPGSGTETITFAEGCIPAGTYELQVHASNVEGGDSSNVACCATLTTSGGEPPAIEYEPASVSRLAGGDRFETAVEVSKFQFPRGSARVTLANASVQVDALPGSQLGGGPILYVPSQGDVPEVVLDEVARLNPTEIIVLGGRLAVNDQVVAQIQQQTSHRVN